MEDCIEAPGCKDRQGYARKRFDGKEWKAHRLAWFRVHGPIPEGMVVMHRCDNPSCINLDHLRLGTQQDNLTDCKAKGRQARGSRMGRSKLTEETAMYAMARLLVGESQPSVALAFGVNYATLSMLWTGRTWAWLFESDAAADTLPADR